MMARSFSSVKIISALVSDGFRNALIRRGYAAATRGVVMKKEEAVRATTEKVAWVPDPVTGYYRPENYVDEIDAVDLRAMFLKPRGKVIDGRKEKELECAIDEKP